MDKIIAIPLIIILGGVCCRPSALRSKLNTTTIFANEVVTTATKGTSASNMTVINADDGEKLEISIAINLPTLQ